MEEFEEPTLSYEEILSEINGRRKEEKKNTINKERTNAGRVSENKPATPQKRNTTVANKRENTARNYGAHKTRIAQSQAGTEAPKSENAPSAQSVQKRNYRKNDNSFSPRKEKSADERTTQEKAPKRTPLHKNANHKTPQADTTTSVENAKEQPKRNTRRSRIAKEVAKTIKRENLKTNAKEARHMPIETASGSKIKFFDTADTRQQLASRGGRRGVSKRTNLQAKDEEEINPEFLVERDPHNLKVMFLGGVGEIGKNMTVLEYGDDIIVVDAGLSFPTENMPGIDIVVPDITYLVENKDKVRGFVITHGHEDHIGGLPYTLNEIHAPVYGSKLTNAFIQNKLREHPRVKAKFVEVQPRETVQLGCFSVEFLHVNHSIVGAYAVSITTPVGVVFHTGDFKIDLTPVDGQIADTQRMKEIGDKGVLLLLCESTNVERAGHSMSESRVGESLDMIFGENVGKRIFVATFASNVHRIQQICNTADKYGRKVAFSGRSMIKNMEVASRLNELHFDMENVIDIDRIENFPDGELCIITTGSQGEPMSGLSRIASGDFNKVVVSENDCFILSSSPIPGNERAVNNTINALFKRGADVIYEYLMPLHVSGHGYYDEIKEVHDLLRPKYFVPIHGEYKHLKHHKDLALKCGMYESDVKICEIGDCIEVNQNVFKDSGKVPSGSRLIDGLGFGEIDSSVLKDRIALSEEGLCVTVVAIDRKKGIIKNGPEIITRGLVYASEASSLVEEARQFVRETLLQSDLKNCDIQVLKINVRKALSSFFNRKTRRNPTVLTIILDIK